MSIIENPEELKAQITSEAKSLWQKIYSGAQWLWSMVPPLHPAGVPFVTGFAITSLLITLLWDDFFVIGVLLTLWCAYFFRDPKRITPQGDGLVIAPADGMVSAIESVSLPNEFDTDDTSIYTRISIFLNVFDVHVQRVPADGVVKEVVYRPGKFMNAALDKASDENERSSVLMELADGRKVAFVQIAGWIARRIINNLKASDSVTAGTHYGLIRFGSRVDVYLPEGVAAQVCVGQRMIGGETLLAQLNGTQTTRTGIAR